MSRAALADLLELPVGERIKLAQALWDSVVEQADPYPISAAESAQIDRRLEGYRRQPETASPWEEVKSRLLGKP